MSSNEQGRNGDVNIPSRFDSAKEWFEYVWGAAAGDETPDEFPKCDVDGCERDARYKETGDGSALRDPRWRCYSHQPTGGLWWDLEAARERADE